MSEFKSKLEDLMPATELDFDPTPAFGKYWIYLNHAVTHPAKMNTNLLEFLIKNFTEPNETILDPMAGSGSTGVVASLLGRNAVQIDIEPKFYEWMEKARVKAEKSSVLTLKGKIINMLGDARNLSQLLNQTNCNSCERNSVCGRMKHSNNPDNIGNLPHGNIDAIITSPPYLKSAEHGAGINKQREWDVKIGCSTKNRTVTHPEAIDNADEYGSIDAMGEKKGGSETYLEAMLKVYGEMYKVLKPTGRAIIVVKPFIRRKTVIDLPLHTYILMSKCGFVLEKLYKLRLKQQSFWRILYYKKYSDVPRITHEYVLIMKKS